MLSSSSKYGMFPFTSIYGFPAYSGICDKSWTLTKEDILFSTLRLLSGFSRCYIPKPYHTKNGNKGHHYLPHVSFLISLFFTPTHRFTSFYSLFFFGYPIFSMLLQFIIFGMNSFRFFDWILFLCLF